MKVDKLHVSEEQILGSVMSSKGTAKNALMLCVDARIMRANNVLMDLQSMKNNC